MIPEAHIVHQIAGRLRLRIPSERGNPAFFADLERSLAECPGLAGCRTQPVTAGVVIWGDALSVDQVAAHAASHQLFDLCPFPQQRLSLAEIVASPIQDMNTTVRRFTGGDLDMGGLFFLTLLGFGIYELIRGNFKTPPWYTAFWYAFGVFSKSIMDQMGAKNGQVR